MATNNFLNFSLLSKQLNKNLRSKTFKADIFYLQECNIGMNFSFESEAGTFYDTVMGKYFSIIKKSINVNSKETVKITTEKNSQTKIIYNSNHTDKVVVPSMSSLANNNQPVNCKMNITTEQPPNVIATGENIQYGKIKKFPKKFDKSSIGTPSNFRVVQHIGLSGSSLVSDQQSEKINQIFKNISTKAQAFTNNLTANVQEKYLDKKTTFSNTSNNQSQNNNIAVRNKSPSPLLMPKSTTPVNRAEPNDIKRNLIHSKEIKEQITLPKIDPSPQLLDQSNSLCQVYASEPSSSEENRYEIIHHNQKDAVENCSNVIVICHPPATPPPMPNLIQVLAISEPNAQDNKLIEKFEDTINLINDDAKILDDYSASVSSIPIAPPPPPLLSELSGISDVPSKDAKNELLKSIENFKGGLRPIKTSAETYKNTQVDNNVMHHLSNALNEMRYYLSEKPLIFKIIFIFGTKK